MADQPRQLPRATTAESAHGATTPSCAYIPWLTVNTRIMPSVYPANSVLPSALHARDTQYGTMAFLPYVLLNSGRKSSTTLLLSRSQILMELWVAAHSQYLPQQVTNISSQYLVQQMCVVAPTTSVSALTTLNTAAVSRHVLSCDLPLLAAALLLK